MISSLSPAHVLCDIAAALPSECLPNVVIIGSLAGAFHFFGDDNERSVRTKDVDCMFVPHAKAVSAAGAVVTTLMHQGWRQYDPTGTRPPGTATTPVDELPMIRLSPPADLNGSRWFLELLGAPDPDSSESKTFYGVDTPDGRLAICSFSYLALTQWHPTATEFGICVARPEMMALANLLHHQSIKDDLIGGTLDKRSNKDLGRVLALALLARLQDPDALDQWAANMAAALQACFPKQATSLALSAGLGIRALMSSPHDLDQALAINNRGLLSSMPTNPEILYATGRQFIQLVIEPLERMAKEWG